MKPVPRPARVLLAGRFLAPRASMLALPDGPVAALDLANGELVTVAFGPRGASDELEARVGRLNELALPGSPFVRELCWHLGRPLVAFAPSCERSIGTPAHDVVARARALGEALDRADAGLPLGPADLALGADGPFLRRPAIWPGDTARPLADALAERASHLLGRRAPTVPDAASGGSMRLRAVPASRRARLALVIACGLLAALVVSSLAGSSHGGGVARAAPLRVVPAPLAAARPRLRPPIAVHARRARPTTRGGAARVLLADVPVSVAPPAPRAAPRPAVASAAPAPTPGWVAGLFVGT